MNIFGISAGFHDAAITVLQDNKIVFAGHAERYSKRKNDANLNDDLVADALSYGNPDQIVYYERPWIKKLQQLYSGQYNEAANFDNFTIGQHIRKYIHVPVHQERLLSCPRRNMSHHLSHAAAGFQTSPYQKATVVVIDAIGELDTVSIYGAEYVNGRAQYRKLWGQRYPHSIGLFYSAMTQAVGLKPNEEEYIMMGMSAYGTDAVITDGLSTVIKNKFVADEYAIEFKENLHAGADLHPFDYLEKEDIAYGAQRLAERLIYNVMHRAKMFDFSSNLVYMGGVALNCLANRNLGDYFDNIWIMPNPGDAGSSLGAAALAYGGPLVWRDAYLGTNIAGDYPVNGLLDTLLTEKIVGVASGRAEFGPRALGNRSLLADPRGPDIKDRVNEIKRRQKFRPFAPVILEEMVDEYFDVPRGWSDSRYMQLVGKCRRPDLFPAIVHVDGTSRIQTVPQDGSGIRQLLEKWYVMTDCPMLLNTSLNIRGEPMVNDRADADRFEKMYNVKVCS
jgi:carbamoyltransferase